MKKWLKGGLWGTFALIILYFISLTFNMGWFRLIKSFLLAIVKYLNLSVINNSGILNLILFILVGIVGFIIGLFISWLYGNIKEDTLKNAK
ncbi:MAG: hypothetical protein WC438_05030 [Candidatus Pacearchaeota archaeon]